MTSSVQFNGTFTATTLVGSGAGVTDLTRANIAKSLNHDYVMINTSDGSVGEEAQLSTVRGGLGGDWSAVSPTVVGGHTTYFIPGITSTGTFGQLAATDAPTLLTAGSVVLRDATGVIDDPLAYAAGYEASNGWISGGMITLADQIAYPLGFYVSTVKVRWTDYGSSDNISHQETLSPPVATRLATYTLDGDSPSGPPQFYADRVTFPDTPVIGIYIDNTGTLQQDGASTNVSKMYASWIQLGVLAISPLLGLFALANIKRPIADRVDLEMLDFANNVSPLNLGTSQVSANALLDLTIDVGSGSFWEINSNILVDRYQPNTRRFPASSIVPVTGVWQDNTPRLIYSNLDYYIDVEHYNPNALSAPQPTGDPPADLIPLNTWVNMAILFNPASSAYVYQYPTEYYAGGEKNGTIPPGPTETAVTSGAIAGIGKMIRLSAYEEAKAFVVIGYITFPAGAVDFSDAIFSPGEYFNYTVGGSAGSSTSGGGATAPYRAANTAWVDYSLGSDLAGTATYSNLPFASIGTATGALNTFLPSATNTCTLIFAAGTYPMDGVVDPATSPLFMTPFISMIGRSNKTTSFNTNNINTLYLIAGPAFSSTNNAVGSCKCIRLLGTTSLDLDLVATADSATNTASFSVEDTAVCGATIVNGRANGVASPPSSADAFMFTNCEFTGNVDVNAGTAIFNDSHMSSNTVAITATTLVTNVTLSNCTLYNLTVTCTSVVADVVCNVILSGCEIHGAITFTGAVDRVFVRTDRGSIGLATSYTPGTASVAIYDAELTAAEIAGVKNASTALTSINPVVDQTTFRAATVCGKAVYGNPSIYAVDIPLSGTAADNVFANGIKAVTQTPYTTSDQTLATTAFVYSLGNQDYGFPVINNVTHKIGNTYVDYANSGSTIFANTWASTSYPVAPLAGQYWVLTANVTVSGGAYPSYVCHTGDWIIFVNSTWYHVDNYDYGIKALAANSLVATAGSGDTLTVATISAYSVVANVTGSGSSAWSSLGYSTGNANPASSLVAKDSSGNFTAGTITATAIGATTAWNGAVIGASYGGAGTVNGLLKANGSGTVSAAVAYPTGGYNYVSAPYNVTFTGIVAGSGTTSVTTSWGTGSYIPQYSVPANTSGSSAAPSASLPYTSTATNSALVLRDSSAGAAVGILTATSIIGPGALGAGCTWASDTIPSNRGGAGSVNGIMKANGSGTVSAAVAYPNGGYDYVSAPYNITFTGIVAGSGSTSVTTTWGSGSNIDSYSVAANTTALSAPPSGFLGYSYSPVNGALVLRDGSGNANVKILFATSISGTGAGGSGCTWNSDVIPSSKGGAGSVNGILKANGSGTVSAATLGTDYLSNALQLTGAVTGTVGASQTISTSYGAIAANSVMANNTAGSAVPTAVALANAATATSVMIRDGSANVIANNMIESIASQTGAVALTAASAKNQRFTTVTVAVAVNLPSATTIVAGTSYNIINDSAPSAGNTGALDVTDGNGGKLCSVTPTQRCKFTLVTAGSTAGTWTWYYKSNIPNKLFSASTLSAGATYYYTGATALTAAACYAGAIAGSGTFAFTFPTAANMISGLTTLFGTGVAPPNGFAFPLQIFNAGTGTLSIVGNTGVTLYGTFQVSSQYYSLQLWICIVSPTSYYVLNGRDF